MKFLCGNCKAKYQIADEKVTGRTLRMKCRRCGHDILIDGHTMPQSSAPSSVPAPAPRRGGSTVSVVPGSRGGGSGAGQSPTRAANALPRPTAARSKPPSGLSAEFRRHVAAPPEVPQRSAPYDLWHVAIQDVPVGPMTRDELSRKIEAGAVTPESLCWREGMDDWRPVGELAELASLLRRNREAPRPMRGRPPPNVPGPGASGSGSRSAPLPLPPGALAPQSEEYDEDNAEPTRISEFTPGLSLTGSGGTLPQQFGATTTTGNTSPKVYVPQQIA
ncbi:MAG TPA: GYF domain-containing protein, partial [Polyangiales bacterium]